MPLSWHHMARWWLWKTRPEDCRYTFFPSFYSDDPKWSKLLLLNIHVCSGRVITEQLSGIVCIRRKRSCWSHDLWPQQITEAGTVAYYVKTGAGPSVCACFIRLFLSGDASVWPSGGSRAVRKHQSLPGCIAADRHHQTSEKHSG